MIGNTSKPMKRRDRSSTPLLRRLVRSLLAIRMSSQSVARLTALKDAKLSELAKTIDLATTGHRDAALELVQAGRGKHLMDEMRSLLDLLTVHAEARSSERP